MSQKGGRLSLLLGLLTGTLTGLLFAPSKGEKLREKIVKERKAGGWGQKAVGEELSKMVDEMGDLVKEVSHRKELKDLWSKTNETVNEMTEGNVDLDQWAKQVSEKADLIKKTIHKYALERKKALTQVKRKTGQTVKGVRKLIKKSVKASKKAVGRRKISKK